MRILDNWEVVYGVNGKFYINVCRLLNFVLGCSGIVVVCLKEKDKVINLGELCRVF